MSLLTAAVIPSAPLLVPELAGGSVAADADLRKLVGAAVAHVAVGDGELVVVGPAPQTASYEGTWDWSGFGVRRRGQGEQALPLSLAIAARFLDEVLPGVRRTYQGVRASDGPTDCVALGRRLAGNGPVRLLVVGDGSARRTEKAPGHLDPRAEAFDEEVERALRDGDGAALAALSPALATELMAAGRPAWQVLAGATGGADAQGDVSYADAPHGVCYLVATWSCRSRP